MKEYFKNSIAYYYKHLRKSGCGDPLQVIASDFVNTIQLSDLQKEFVLSNAKPKKVENIILILKKMQSDKKIDNKAIDIIIKELNELI